LKLQDPISTIPLIGPKYQKNLANLAIHNIQDLLYYFPRNYFDSSKLHKISSLNHQEKKSFIAQVKSIKSVRTRKRNFTIQTALVEDENDEVELVWFNQPFLKNSLKEGQKYIFSGKLNPKSYNPQVQSPVFEEIKEEQTHVGIITPSYPLTESLSNKWLRSRIKWLIKNFEFVTDITENLPPKIIKQYELLDIRTALRNIHFPKNDKLLKKARHRLGFEELLEIQLKIVKARKEQEKFIAPKIKLSKKSLDKLLNSLEFELTPDQQKVYKDLLEDLSKETPTSNLISGDVGSGKTIIAIISSLAAATSSYQTAILAPTTVLAKQHFDTFSKTLLPFDIKCELLTKDQKTPSKSDIVIGTHSILFQKAKAFDRLGLVIIDEQHRFGVEQRQELKKFFTKDKRTVHTLSMTATPIPRTLALTLFGDMKVNTIKSKPKKRKIVKSFLVPEKKRTNSYKWIKDKINEGIQVFWIAPLIESDEKSQIKSIQELEKNLKTNLADTKIQTLHGKMKEIEKQAIIKDFKSKKFDILLSTSVIEVGIDIANANIIVIEGAERFGLAQLHQLRGRVGRSEAQAWCFLYTTTEPNEDQKSRLEYFVKENDGFKLAEFDLNRRGPGEVYGTKQAGIPNLKIANIFDLELVKTTRQAAEDILS